MKGKWFISVLLVATVAVALAGCSVDDSDSIDTPSGVTIEATSSTTIMLRWNKVDGAKGYRIYYNNVDADAHYNCIEGCSYSYRIQGTAYEDKGLRPGETYYYKVTALKWKDGEYDTYDGSYNSAEEIESSKSKHASITMPKE